MHEVHDRQEASLSELLQRLSPYDLILVEGFKAERHSKMEVFRQAVGKVPRHPGDPHIVAIASDQAFPEAHVPVVNLDDIEAVADIVSLRAEPLDNVLTRL